MPSGMLCFGEGGTESGGVGIEDAETIRLGKSA